MANNICMNAAQCQMMCRELEFLTTKPLLIFYCVKDVFIKTKTGCLKIREPFLQPRLR
jgi:hypothetical protein